MELKGQVALITGASSGIGRRVGVGLAGLGGRHYQGQCLSPNGGAQFR
ncbi:MAG: hypothetical protein MUC71_09360 [Steroidobacteraceae bacterium]|nr:hypothetical protein [Steroidobacteraceae bacterium]